MVEYGIGVCPPHAVIAVFDPGLSDVFTVRIAGTREEVGRFGVRRTLQHAARNGYSDPDIYVPQDVTTAGLVPNQTAATNRLDDWKITNAEQDSSLLAGGLADTADELFGGAFATPSIERVDKCARAADELVLVTDASHVPEGVGFKPGAACGFVLATPNGILLDCAAITIPTAKASMEAEIRGLYRGLARANSYDANNVRVYSDQRLMIRAFSGRAAFDSNRLQRLINKCESAFYEFSSVTAEHVDRRSVAAADRLARMGVLRSFSLRQIEPESSISNTDTKYSTV